MLHMKKKSKGERHHIHMVKKLAVQAQAPFKKNLKRHKIIIFYLFWPVATHGYCASIHNMVIAIGRPIAEQAELYIDGHGNKSTNAIMINATSVNESKFVLKFCSKYLRCRYKDGSHRSCWCWDTCPTCDPKCHGPPQQRAIEANVWIVFFYKNAQHSCVSFY
jgi:hypothetical protein